MAAFEAELGANGLRQKEHAGDRATPEGLYRVVRMKEGKATKYYKALLVDYPNDSDRARFAAMKRQGRIPRRAGIGGMIEIHGEGGQGNDWTDGCVALTNKNMDTLFARVTLGTPVAIVGNFGG
jgi:murein L,D-transpeptidase YafK